MARDAAQQTDALGAAIKATDHLAFALINIRSNELDELPSASARQHAWNCFLGVVAALVPLKPPERPDPLITPASSDVTETLRHLVARSQGTIR